VPQNLQQESASNSSHDPSQSGLRIYTEVPLQTLLRIARRPPTLIGFAMIIWALAEIGGPYVFGRRVPLLQIVWLRYAFYLAFMIVALGPRYGLGFVRTRHPWMQLVRSGTMLIMPAAFAVAAQELRISQVMSVFWIAPAMLLLFARVAGDHGSRLVWLTTLSAWVGVLIVHRPPVLVIGWPGVAALVGAASFSGYLVLTWVVDRKETLLTNLFHSAAGVFVALTFAMPFVWTPIGLYDVLGAAALGACTWMVFCFLELGIREAGPSAIAPFLFTQALIEAGVRIGIRGPDIPLVAGSLVIVGAMALWLWRVNTNERVTALHYSTVGAELPRRTAPVD
jgi:hypothetical protein